MAQEARIKDFSITDLQMMEGTDGYVIRCNLLYKGKKLGTFFDKGDGGEYYFYPVEGISQWDVEDMLVGEDFPPIDSFFPNMPPVEWNIGILVEELIERQELDERIKKAKKDGRDLVVIDDNTKGTRTFVNFKSLAPDEAIAMYVKVNFGENVKWVRY